MIPVAIDKLLSSSDPAVRKNGWRNLWKDRRTLDSGRTIGELENKAFEEEDAEIAAFAFGMIEGLRRSPSVSLQELLRRPFDPGARSATRNRRWWR